MGAKIKIINKKNINGEIVGDIFVESSTLKSIKLSEEIAPRLIDEYPILFVAASFASGISSFKGLRELKFKESNRLIEMADSLKNSGVDLEVEENSLKLEEKLKQRGGLLLILNKIIELQCQCLFSALHLKILLQLMTPK